ncbi:MAG: Txe/YoeB family addiction module toxin [Bifidobacteriaceae bacterium]|nr:Txe/YoeB family addiction module toxin [Bifidobacteriaceae bacterium]
MIKNSARGDLRKLRDAGLRSRFEDLVTTLRHDPYQPSDHFEKLRPRSARRYSRRLNYQHQLVYTVDDAARTVTILAAWSHYET